MNIFFTYNKNEIKFENKIQELEEFIENNNNTYKIKILSKITSRTNCDFNIIMSDDIDEISKYFDKLKDKENVLIITSNITACHVLKCTTISNNITFLGNKCDLILNKVNKIYENSKNKL